MKYLEYIGVGGTVLAYSCIVTGNMVLGLVLGLFSQTILTSFFYHKKIFATMWLQFFFVCANIYGLINLGV